MYNIYNISDKAKDYTTKNRKIFPLDQGKKLMKKELRKLAIKMPLKTNYLF